MLDPTAAALAVGALPWAAAAPLRVAAAAVELRRAVRRVKDRNARRTTPPPPSPFGAPRTVINGAISPRREFATVLVSCEDARRAGASAKASANDVVMALCGGALRGYLERRSALPDGSLVALIPVALTKRNGTSNHIGNGVESGMLTSLGTEFSDPRERLEAVRDWLVRRSGDRRGDDPPPGRPDPAGPRDGRAEALLGAPPRRSASPAGQRRRQPCARTRGAALPPRWPDGAALPRRPATSRASAST